ncbi:globin-coupled sensor protein [Sporosarcina sp. GW1-11]|uniref:globin-coupled sensor protein n=1 Tax=Sporosarcina sp. GW1-11 TaxID=2899126 RepID=UPI00294ED928|nr:globin-coupled sensor protein [Sporosarcina sp. GW1-11]MDV6379072.1 globin-coupled sensor protein [Sporosarcina sp. GW1-11]
MIRLFNKGRIQTDDRYQEDLKPVTTTISLERYPTMKKQIQMINLTEVDLEYLVQIREQVKPMFSTMTDAFYKAMDAEPDLLRIISEHSSIERLKVSLQKHMESLFEGRIDASYLEQRKTIAKIHVRIGLEPKWYLAAFEMLHDGFFTFIEQLDMPINRKFNTLRAFMKVLNLEQQLVLDAYEEFNEVNRQQVEKEKAIVKDQVLNASRELAAISEQTSASTEELSAKSQLLEETTIQNLSFITETESTSLHGKELMNTQSKQFEQIVTYMADLMSRMDALYTSSDQIGEVVTLITTIADQTNLLSLNAAIEAARAGQHGKGFAVVATEVRNLSVETKQAIGKVSGIIEETNTNINDMSKFVRLMEQLIQKSAQNNEQVTHSYDEIVQAVSGMKEQAAQSRTSIKNTVKILQEINQAIETIAHSSDGLMQLAEDF